MWHYFIGDIHGCYQELLQLEDLIHQHAQRHKQDAFVVSVGDLVDRGPDSHLVVRHFRHGVDANTHAVVLGNHDIMTVNALWNFGPACEVFNDAPLWCASYRETYEQGLDKPFGYATALSLEEFEAFRRYMWLGQGGAQTLRSFGCDPSDVSTWRLPDDDLRFLMSCPLVWQNERVIVTHALVSEDALHTLRKHRPHVHLDDEEHTQYRRAVQSATWSRSAPKTWSSDKIHVSGHTVVPKARWKRRGAILQLDTGCVFGQRLTAWCAETSTFLRVPHNSAS